MSSRRAAGKLLGALILAVGFARGAFAEDLGEKAVFASPAIATSLWGQPPSGPQANVLWQSGLSARIVDAWDTVLFQGVCPDTAAVFQVSREDAAGQWTPWQDAAAEQFPHGRFWAKFTFPAAAPGAVRLQAVDNGVVVAAASQIEVLSVEVFDSGAPAPGNKQTLPQLLVVGGGTRPAVIPREAWRAKPPTDIYDPLLPYRITLHHTDGIQPMTQSEAEAELRFIQDFHQHGRGWIDIAYHFLIDGAGRIYEGRPETVEGSHTLHNNEGNIGIALMGTYERPKNDQVTPAQRDALVRLGQYLVQHYGIDPKSLKGHRDYKQTSCPGDNAYALIPALRLQFAQTQALAKGAGKPKQPKKGVKTVDWDGQFAVPAAGGDGQQPAGR